MSKQYLITRTIEYKDKTGKKLIIKPSKEPQSVPTALVKELLARELAIEVGGTSAAAPPSSEGGDDNTEGPGTGE